MLCRCMSCSACGRRSWRPRSWPGRWPPSPATPTENKRRRGSARPGPGPTQSTSCNSSTCSSNNSCWCSNNTWRCSNNTWRCNNRIWRCSNMTCNSSYSNSSYSSNKWRCKRATITPVLSHISSTAAHPSSYRGVSSIYFNKIMIVPAIQMNFYLHKYLHQRRMYDCIV